MWMFTQYGFFSVSCGRVDPSRTTSPVDPNTKMIRARSRLHLENLQDRFPNMLAHYEVKESAGTDYAFRIVVPAAVYEKLALALAEEINYGNFKSQVGRANLCETTYTSLLHSVWSQHFGFQQRLLRPKAPSFPRSLFDSHDSGRYQDQFDEADVEVEEEESYDIDEIAADADGEAFQETHVEALPPGTPFVVISRRERKSAPSPVAVLIGFPPGRGRKIARYAAEVDAIDRIPKSRLKTERGVVGVDDLPKGVRVYDLQYEIDFQDVEETPMSESETPKPRVVEANLSAKSESASFSNKRPAPLVEDTSVAGGLDAQGNPVIATKRADGSVSESVQPTDPREKSEN